MIWENCEMLQILEEENKNKSFLPIQLRFLNSMDLHEVKTLCEDSFPISYPQTWYEEITSNQNSKFYSIAAVYNLAIIGILVAEIGKPWQKLNKEDRTILSENYGKGPILTAYILSLGVHRKYRRNGVASFLLRTFIEHLQQEQNSKIKAIYLHVLTTNKDAILFYEKFDFQLHSFLPYYYSIKGKAKDGFCYVRYINGGKQPQNSLICLCEYVQNLCLNIFKFKTLASYVSNCIRNICSWLNYGWFHNKVHYFRQ